MGVEFATGYELKYWRPQLGKWVVYKDIKGEEVRNSIFNYFRKIGQLLKHLCNSLTFLPTWITESKFVLQINWIFHTIWWDYLRWSGINNFLFFLLVKFFKNLIHNITMFFNFQNLPTNEQKFVLRTKKENKRKNGKERGKRRHKEKVSKAQKHREPRNSTWYMQGKQGWINDRSYLYYHVVKVKAFHLKTLLSVVVLKLISKLRLFFFFFLDSLWWT